MSGPVHVYGCLCIMRFLRLFSLTINGSRRCSRISISRNGAADKAAKSSRHYASDGI